MQIIVNEYPLHSGWFIAVFTNTRIPPFNEPSREGTDPDSLPPPDEIASEIVVSLEAALEKFRSVAAKLGAEPAV